MVRLGRLREHEELLAEWGTTHDELGGTSHSRAWFATAHASAEYYAGRWDRALEGIEEFLAGLPEGTTHYLESSMRSLQASIELAGDRLAEARVDAERAVAAAYSDPQAFAPSLCTRATVRLAEGLKGEAGADLQELLAFTDRLVIGLNIEAQLPAFAWLALDLGRGDDAGAILDSSPPGGWLDVARAILAGDAATAADLLGEIGHRPAEAYARLRAGGGHVHAALEFYRSVGAVRYVREAEASLAASF
jgi:hypothetical protein